MVLIARREAQPLDLLEQGMAGNGWEAFESMVLPEIRPQLEADDQLAKYAYYLSRDPLGRKFIEWIMDITVRQRLTQPGRSVEEMALAASNLAGWQGVGDTILAAIVKGDNLINGA